MNEHFYIWKTIEYIASFKGLSLSRLAIECGLDSTAFNPCKWYGKNGIERFPRTSTIFKICNYCNISFVDFANVYERITKKKWRRFK